MLVKTRQATEYYSEPSFNFLIMNKQLDMTKYFGPKWGSKLNSINEQKLLGWLVVATVVVWTVGVFFTIIAK